MTVCYAYEYGPCSNTGDPCAGCGHYYWEHSHWLSTSSPRPRRYIIGKYGAMDNYDWHHARREPRADVRDRYQMMMDRQPGTCEWIQARMTREVEKQADAFLKARSDAEREAIAPGSTTIYPLTYGQAQDQTEPVEITTWGDMMNRHRRWLLADGTNHIESTHYPENTP